MKRALTLITLSLLLTAGCSNQKLLPADTSSFTVDSQPQGATVYVMGQAVGTTPTRVMRKQVFPVAYPDSLQREYGTVTLDSPDCESYRIAVSNRILEDGLMAKLHCEQSVSAPTTKRAQSSAAVQADDSTKDRLIQLKELYEEGLITEEEYSAKRGTIIDEL